MFPNLIAAALLLGAQGGEETSQTKMEAVDGAAAAPGKIVIYRRSSLAGLANACPVRYKGKEITELARGRYFEWSVQPGRYILENKTSSVEVSVDPGETRYVRCQMKTGVMTYRADLQIVDGTEFEQVAGDFKRAGES